VHQSGHWDVLPEQGNVSHIYGIQFRIDAGVAAIQTSGFYPV
jgi:hypothetical protein